MSATNKENTANLNVSISRRAKKDAKRLALSPMKDSTGKSPASSPGLEENMRPKSDAEKTQHKIKELEGQNNSLHAQLAVSKVTYEQMERKLNEKIQTLEQTLKRVREESQKKYESEHEKVRNLKKEVNRLQKDNETKTQKIDRLEEYLQISKDISNNLQNEKKMLEAQIQNEKDMIRRLEALTESARKESENVESIQYEAQVANLTEELTQVRGQLEASEERLFLTTALSIKLNYFNDGIGSQLNNAELYERVKQQNIPREKWGKFIQDTLMAMHAAQEAASPSVTSTSVAAVKSPAARGNKSAAKNNSGRANVKQM